MPQLPITENQRPPQTAKRASRRSSPDDERPDRGDTHTIPSCIHDLLCVRFCSVRVRSAMHAITRASFRATSVPARTLRTSRVARMTWSSLAALALQRSQIKPPLRQFDPLILLIFVVYSTGLKKAAGAAKPQTTPLQGVEEHQVYPHWYKIRWRTIRLRLCR